MSENWDSIAFSQASPPFSQCLVCQKEMHPILDQPDVHWFCGWLTATQLQSVIDWQVFHLQSAVRGLSIWAEAHKVPFKVYFQLDTGQLVCESCMAQHVVAMIKLVQS